MLSGAIRMITAYILLTTKVGTEKKVLEDIQKNTDNSLKEVWITYGDYDIIIKVELKDWDTLNEFIVHNLRGIQSVVSTNTLIKI